MILLNYVFVIFMLVTIYEFLLCYFDFPKILVNIHPFIQVIQSNCFYKK